MAQFIYGHPALDTESSSAHVAGSVVGCPVLISH